MQGEVKEVTELWTKYVWFSDAVLPQDKATEKEKKKECDFY